MQTNAEFILTVQDDAYFHPDSKAFLDAIVWPSDAGFISLYTPKHYSDGRQPGLNRIRTSSLWGACALAWRRESLEQVIAHTIAHSWCGVPPKSAATRSAVMERRKRQPDTIANSDTAIGRILNAMGLSMYFVDPSPVQHIAPVSSISHGGNEGRRNCSRCADHRERLVDQVFPVTHGPAEYQNAMRAFQMDGGSASFAVTPDLWVAIRNSVAPGMHTMEFGAGVSTAAFSGCIHRAIEQDEQRASRLAAEHHELRDGWYQKVAIEKTPAVILIDGPHGGNRAKAFPFTVPTLEIGGTVFIDDCRRESSLLALYSEAGYTIEQHEYQERHWCRITSASGAP